MSEWKPLSDNSFPYPYKDVIIAAFSKDASNIVDVFRSTCGEQGAYFSKSSHLLTLIEEGWIPFAWCIDDVPIRDDVKFPPMLVDYITENANE